MSAQSTYTLAPQPSPFAVFRNRSFTLLWSGQLISTIGDALTGLAAGIYVYRLTGSALSVGLVLVATALPTLLVGLIAGVVADRFDRKKIMIVTALIRAVLVFFIPILLPHSIVWLYVIVALSAGVGQFYDPAHESVLPEVASDEELAAANSMMAISAFGSTAIGFAASGLIASQFAIEWAFYIDALSFVVVAACIFFIRIKPLEVEGKTSVSVVVHNLRAGADFLFKHTVLRSVFITGIFYILSIGMWNTLLLPFSIQALHATEFEYGLQEGLTSVGFVIGSLVMARLADRLREGQWVVISLVGMSIVGMLYSVSTSVPIAIFWVIISGFMNAPYGIARRLLVQRNTPREMRGRVNSTFFVSRDIIVVIGMVAAGLADVVDVRLLMFVSSAIILIPGVMSMLMPGLGQPAAEWRRALTLLRGVRTAPGIGVAHAATLADFDRLAARLPAAAGLSESARRNLVNNALVSGAAAGAAIVKTGEKSNAAYFIIEGRAVAGVEKDGEYRLLEVLNAGDFFGEIAALTGSLRTADVIVEEPVTLFEVPAESLRSLMADPSISKLVLSKMNERLNRLISPDLPRLAGIDQTSLRELRTVQAEG